MLKPQEFSLGCLGFYEKCQWRKKLTVKQEAKTEGRGPEQGDLVHISFRLRFAIFKVKIKVSECKTLTRESGTSPAVISAAPSTVP